MKSCAVQIRDLAPATETFASHYYQSTTSTNNAGPSKYLLISKQLQSKERERTELGRQRKYLIPSAIHSFILSAGFLDRAYPSSSASPRRFD